jgi:hypothetical protein
MKLTGWDWAWVALYFLFNIGIGVSKHVRKFVHQIDAAVVPAGHSALGALDDGAPDLSVFSSQSLMSEHCIYGAFRKHLIRVVREQKLGV